MCDLQRMELSGALWNLYKDPGSLPKLLTLKEKLLSRSAQPRSVRQGPLKPRQSQVLETVKHVLAYADKPLRAKDIQAGCEQLLAKPVSLGTINHILYRHTKGSEALIVRVSYGRYGVRNKT